MASVRRKPRSPFWWCCYTDHDGRQRQRSSRSTSRSTALDLANTYERAYRNRQTESQVRRVMSDVFEDLHGRPLNDITFGAYADQWLERIKPEVEVRTHDRYRGAMAAAKALAVEVFAKRLDRITTADLVDLRAKMLAERSHATTKANMKAVAQVIKSAWSDGLMPDNPAARLRPLRVERKAAGEGKRPFSLDEIGKLMKTADDEWRGMILAGYHTAGQRLSDIATMTPSMVDLANRTVKFSSGKTRRAVVLPISEEWLRDLRKRIAGKQANASLFPRAAGRLAGGPRNVGKLSNSFRTLLSKAGMATPPGTTKGHVPGRRMVSPLSFHSLRHTATSMLKNAGVSDSVVMDLVGHDSAAVSANYTHIDDRTKREALGKLPGIAG